MADPEPKDSPSSTKGDLVILAVVVVGATAVGWLLLEAVDLLAIREVLERLGIPLPTGA